MYIFTGPGLASYRWRPLSSNVRPRKHTFLACMLLILSAVIVLLGLTYALTRRLKSGIKARVRALLTLLILGPIAYLALNIRDEARPGSIEITSEDMQRAAPVAPK